MLLFAPSIPLAICPRGPEFPPIPGSMPSPNPQRLRKPATHLQWRHFVVRPLTANELPDKCEYTRTQKNTLSAKNAHSINFFIYYECELHWFREIVFTDHPAVLVLNCHLSRLLIRILLQLAQNSLPVNNTESM
jgi:hypothetical protein